MTNKLYELIGESIWNTYKDIAYILAEVKSPKEHAKAIRQATQGRAQNWLLIKQQKQHLICEEKE
jgi:hypothetical protein